MKLIRVFALTTAAFAFAAGASAQTVNFYFSQKGSSTAINQVDIGQGTGSQVDLSVWAQVSGGTFNFSAANVFLKYDTTTTGTGLGDVYSTPPTLANNKIAVAGGPHGITNANALFTGGDSVYAGAPGTSPFDFGMDSRYFIGNGGSASAATPFRLFDVRLSNIGLAAGSNYTVSLLNRNGAIEYSTFLQANNGNILNGTTSNLTVRSVVPEPGTYAALGVGLLALLRCRRTRRA